MIERQRSSEEGIVLGWRPLAEADKRVDVLTRHRGRICVLARGALKPSSRNGGNLEPGVHVAFLVKPTGAMPLLTDLRLLTPFLALRSRPRAARRLLALVEIIKRTLPEAKAAPTWYQASWNCLQRLELLSAEGRPDAFFDLVLDRFKLELLRLEGMDFEPGRCEECGALGEDIAMTLRGECRCHTCLNGERGQVVGHLQDALHHLAGYGRKSQPISTAERSLLRRVLHQCFSARMGVELKAEALFEPCLQSGGPGL